MRIKPKKSLGQHFLNSRSVLDKIVAAAKIKEDDTVLEIGPGTGVLTRELLGAGAKVVAVEKDDRVIELLKRDFFEFIRNGRLQIIHGDILELDPVSYISTPYSIVANIPYYITGAILQKFLENEPRPEKMILLVQKEVAERIVARNGKESVLSISVKAFGTPRIISRVPRGAFTPPPKVDSAILEVSEISDERFAESGVNIDRFFQIVKVGFAHKRKFLIRNLESIINPETSRNIWIKSGLNETVRAEDLKTIRWFNLCAALQDLGKLPGDEE